MREGKVFQERTDGPTPHGGTYSIAYFRDEHGRPTLRDDAAIIEIVEYDETDREIFHTRMVQNPLGRGDADGA